MKYEISWKTKVSLLGAITYFVSVIDLFPDTIPVAGYMDDLGVLRYVINYQQVEIAHYRRWKTNRGKVAYKEGKEEGCPCLAAFLRH